MFKCFVRRLVLLTALIASGTQAQVPSALQQTTVPRDEASDDPLGRSTPRGTILGFMKATSRGDYELAVSYLDTTQHGELARELAQQLQVVLDREISIDLNKLSVRPVGNLADPQNPNHDLVGVASSASGKLEIWLDRVQSGGNPPIWLFSKETLKHVPEVYEDIDNSQEVEKYIPAWLKARPFLSLAVWRLFIILLSIPLIFLLGSLIVRLLKPLLAILAQRILGDTGIDMSQSLVAPLRLILFGVLFNIFGNYSYTLLGRNFWRNLGMVLLVFGVTWLSMKVAGIVSEFVLTRRKWIQSSDQIALARLLGRLSQVAILVVGILVVLHLAGVNLAAALTGLGIGGLAVAFAAQKTLENLFGGIMIISDRPVRIGDVCKIGDVSGTVVDIGLRSTRIRTSERTIVTIPNGQLATMNLENFTFRDKFWFHPTVALRRETTADQMRTVLEKIREMLGKHADVESQTARVRFISIGNASQDVEIFAYVFAPDYGKFLSIQEDLLLQVLDVVELSGTSLALPTQITHLVRESDADARRKPKEKSTAAGEQ